MIIVIACLKRWMKTLIIIFCLCFTIQEVYSQNSLTLIIKDAETKQPLSGANILLQETRAGVISDQTGNATLTNIPDGPQTISVSFLSYRPRNETFNFPQADRTLVEILLEAESEQLEEILITTTRSSRSIKNIPTRVEFIGGEELEEKITMQPGNIRMVLSESTGIQTQQTSVASGNSTIRIQGLDGRYTQILKDGFPLYAGFSGGLSIMQIPPLDLRQADVIKGSASTLYGGGAIAGLINLISRQPEEEQVFSVLANGSSAIGLDFSTFYSKRFNKVGVTFYGSHNYNNEYDPADIGFSAIPNYKRYTVNPRLFLYFNENSKLIAGVNASFENRLGGDMKVIKGKSDAQHSFYERNKTNRISTQLHYILKLKNKKTLSAKNSLNLFQRDINQPSYTFSGNQFSSFSEFSLDITNDKLEWAMGLNAWTDKFSEGGKIENDLRDYQSDVVGAFIQNILTATDWLSVESGLRIDYAKVNSNFNGSLQDWLVLPRISLLFKVSRKITSRMGGGLGYKTPNIFTEKGEEQVFRNVRPINFITTKSERSYGINADINYQTAISEDWSFNINQLFFYTRLQRPLVFNEDSLSNAVYYFENADGHIDATGTETNLKIQFKNFKLFWGYTFVDAQNHFSKESNEVPLTAKHRINAVLMYEIEEKLRLGLETFYYSRQQLTTGERTPDYWIAGFSAQYKWEHFSVFINFENFTDTRQTRFGSIYNGSITNPDFKEIYAPMDGFLFNAGFIINL